MPHPVPHQIHLCITIHSQDNPRENFGLRTAYKELSSESLAEPKRWQAAETDQVDRQLLSEHSIQRKEKHKSK